MSAEARVRVAHVVPAMEVGGVEVAIARSCSVLRATADYRVYYVRRRGSLEVGQRSFFRLCWEILTNEWRPEVVVTSLWWSHPFGFAMSALGIRWVAFLHNCGYKRWYQGTVLKAAWRRADVRFVDSDATGDYFSKFAVRQFRIIPHLFADPPNESNWQDRTNDLLWVGRPVKTKRLDLVSDLIKEIAARQACGRVCLVVAGAVPSEFADLKLPKGWIVAIHQSISAEAVQEKMRDSRFYLLLSDFEGMSMSTIEAITAGCVPVVRRVGEIRNYINPGYTLSVSCKESAELKSVAERVIAVWNDGGFAEKTVSELRDNLSSYSSYPDSFLEGLRAAL